MAAHTVSHGTQRQKDASALGRNGSLFWLDIVVGKQEAIQTQIAPKLFGRSICRRLKPRNNTSLPPCKNSAGRRQRSNDRTVSGVLSSRLSFERRRGRHRQGSAS